MAKFCWLCPEDLFLTGFVDFSQVSWYRRQKKLHETDRLLFQTKGSRQTLYIRKVNPSDFGNYSCRAENALGEARTFTELSGLFSKGFMIDLSQAATLKVATHSVIFKLIFGQVIFKN